MTDVLYRDVMKEKRPVPRRWWVVLWCIYTTLRDVFRLFMHTVVPRRDSLWRTSAAGATVQLPRAHSMTLYVRTRSMFVHALLENIRYVLRNQSTAVTFVSALTRGGEAKRTKNKETLIFVHENRNSARPV